MMVYIYIYCLLIMKDICNYCSVHLVHQTHVVSKYSFPPGYACLETDLCSISYTHIHADILFSLISKHLWLEIVTTMKTLTNIYRARNMMIARAVLWPRRFHALSWTSTFVSLSFKNWKWRLVSSLNLFHNHLPPIGTYHSFTDRYNTAWKGSRRAGWSFR